MTVRARFDGKAFVPIDPVDLPSDQMVELDVRPQESAPRRRGSPELLLEIMRSEPHVSKEAMEEFDRALNEGKVPARQTGIFDDLR